MKPSLQFKHNQNKYSKMASVSRKTKKIEFDCKFVKKPPKVVQSECPECLQILHEPYQASCCGNSFCRVCIEKIKTDKNPCPTCKEEKFTTFHDKRLQRSLNGFQVYCSHKQEGCEWKGELGQLDNHLNLSPLPDKQLEGCEYSEIECIYCSELIKRFNITAHQNDLCPKRPFSCEYCHSYETHYEDVIHNHWPVCGYNPVQCPNECGTFPQRQALENHITRDCPNTVINCDFHHVGCDVRLPRKDMPGHLRADTVAHMSLQAVGYGNLKRKFTLVQSENQAMNQQLAVLKQENQQARQRLQQLQQQIVYLQQACDMDIRIAQKIMKSCKYKVFNKIEITVESYTRLKRDGSTWLSPPFYTHPRGYKLCLKFHANGYNVGRGTHVSVYIYLMRGEFDDHLKWPLRGDITIQILNREKKGHCKRISMAKIGRDGQRVIQRERSIHGWGVTKFVPHRVIEEKYLVNNSLRFCITCCSKTSVL